MKPEYYLFASFVFVLLCALMWLYRRLFVTAGGKHKQDGDQREKEKEKEDRLFRLYQNIEEMMDSFEGYVEDTREQMDALKAELSRQIEKSDGLLKRAEATEAKAIAAVAALRPKEPEPKKDAPPPAEPAAEKRGSKQDMIRELLNKGLTVEQIAQRLELSINEVKLVVYGIMTKKGTSSQ